jgi:hypothetical protein
MKIHGNGQNKIIQYPSCHTSITDVELGEHVNTNPQTKQQAIEEELELWGDVYDRNYLIQNVVFCLNCHKVSHFKDWDIDNDNMEK